MAREPDPQGGVTGPQVELLRLAYGAQAAQIVYVAAKLGLADLVKDGPRPAVDLAATAGVDAPSLRRILRALVSLGVFAEAAGESFSLTEMGQYLRADRADSVQPRVIFNTEVLQPLWGELLHTLRTGESGAARVLGMPLFEYFTTHPEVSALFDMTSIEVTMRSLGGGGRVRTAVEFRALLEAGGLTLTEIIPTASALNVIEARPANMESG